MHLSDAEFAVLSKLLRDAVGIHLTPEKKALVTGRLAKRIGDLGLTGYGEYFRRIAHGRDPEERQWAFNALTTNETRFFREPAHFSFVTEAILVAHPRGVPFRVWSAASSTGEEAYSIAMLLADRLGDAPWEVVASDISTRVLEQARTGVYPSARASDIPARYLRSYCMKGTGPREGSFLVERRLRDRVRFLQVNLIGPVPQLGVFDLIFLRNVLIYFDPPTKRRVVSNLLPHLRNGGHLFSGHSESLAGMVDGIVPVKPAIYRKPSGAASPGQRPPGRTSA